LKEFTIGYLLKWRETVLKSEATAINQSRRKTPETKGTTKDSSSNQNQTLRAKALVPALLMISLRCFGAKRLFRELRRG
jgi:hypothetical protein